MHYIQPSATALEHNNKRVNGIPVSLAWICCVLKKEWEVITAAYILNLLLNVYKNVWCFQNNDFTLHNACIVKWDTDNHQDINN